MSESNLKALIDELRTYLPDTRGTLAALSDLETSSPSGRVVLFDSTLSAPAASLDTGTNAIPPGFIELEALLIARTTYVENHTTGEVVFRFNGDAGANYFYEDLTAGGGTATGGNDQTAPETGHRVNLPGTTLAANIPGFGRLRVPAYDGTAFDKVAMLEGGFMDPAAGANARARTALLHWASAAAINQVSVVAQAGGGQLDTGSRLIVIGLGKG